MVYSPNPYMQIECQHKTSQEGPWRPPPESKERLCTVAAAHWQQKEKDKNKCKDPISPTKWFLKLYRWTTNNRRPPLFVLENECVLLWCLIKYLLNSIMVRSTSWTILMKRAATYVYLTNFASLWLWITMPQSKAHYIYNSLFCCIMSLWIFLRIPLWATL